MKSRISNISKEQGLSEQFNIDERSIGRSDNKEGMEGNDWRGKEKEEVGVYLTDANDSRNVLQRNVRDFVMIPVTFVVLLTASYDEVEDPLKEENKESDDVKRQIIFSYLLVSLLGIASHRIETWQLSNQPPLIRYMIELFALVCSFRYHVNVHRYLVLSIDELTLFGLIISIPFAFGWGYHVIYFIWKLQWIIYSIFDGILTIYKSTREFPIDTKLQMMLKYSKDHHKYPIHSASYKSMVKIQEDGLKAISQLKMDRVNPITLIKKRVDDAVLEALINHKENASVQELGMGAILNLSQNSTLKSALIDRNIVSIILSTLETHEHNRKVQVNAIAALRSLCSTTQNRKIMREKEVDSFIIKYLRRHIADAKIQEEAIGALRNLVCDQESHSLVISVIDTIILSLTTHLLDSGVQEQGMGLIRNLSSTKDDCIFLIKEKNILETVLIAMRHHENTHEDGSAAIRHFGAFQETYEYIIQNDELRCKVEDMLINALLVHEDGNHHRVAEQSLGALKNLARNKITVDAIRNKDSFAVIIGILSKFREYFPVVQEGCALIRNLTSFPSEKEIPFISGAHISTLLSDLMGIHRGNEIIQDHCVASLVNLVLNKFDANAFVSDNRVQAILMCFSIHQKSMPIKENCMKALAISSTYEDHHVNIMKSENMDLIFQTVDDSINILEGLITKFQDISSYTTNADSESKLLASAHQNMLKCGCSILINLSKYDANLHKLYRKCILIVQKCLAAYMPIVWAPFAIDNQSISLILGILKNLSSLNVIDIMNASKNDPLLTTNPNANDSANSYSITIHLSNMNKHVENVLKIMNVQYSEIGILEQGLGFLRNISIQSNIMFLKSKSVDNLLMNILGRCCLPLSDHDTMRISNTYIEEQCVGSLKNFILTIKANQRIELHKRLISILKKSDNPRVLEQVYACIRNVTLNSSDSQDIIRNPELDLEGRSVDASSMGNEEEGYISIAPELDSTSRELTSSWIECTNLISNALSSHPNDNKLQEHGCAALLNIVLNHYLGSKAFLKDPEEERLNEDVFVEENLDMKLLLDKVAVNFFNALKIHYMNNRELAEHCLKFFGAYQYLNISPEKAKSFISDKETLFVDVIHHYEESGVSTVKYAFWSVWSMLKTMKLSQIENELSTEIKEKLIKEIKLCVDKHKERVNDPEIKEIEDLDFIQFADFAIESLA